MVNSMKTNLNPPPDHSPRPGAKLHLVLSSLVFGAAIGLAGPAGAAETEKVHPTGYTDTPKLPHSQWNVHDDERPRPLVVAPGATDDAPPADAMVLFDGTNLDRFVGKEGKTPAWKVENGYMEMTPTGDLWTRQEFGDCQLHIEWASPATPRSNSQHRGNSGIFMMNRYEIQVLDCFANKTYADGHAGGLYGQHPPLVNVSRKPGEWQSYDIVFTAPRFQDGELASPAYVTLFHNGVLVQNHSAMLGATTHRAVASYKEHPAMGPIRLQDHNDQQPVRFRNIWIRSIEPKVEGG
jgi:hypothetical protein